MLCFIMYETVCISCVIQKLLSVEMSKCFVRFSSTDNQELMSCDCEGVGGVATCKNRALLVDLLGLSFVISENTRLSDL